MFFWIVLAAFWGLAIRLWIVDGPKIPLIFMGMWIIGIIVASKFKVTPWFFLAYESILSATLYIIEKYKSAT